MDLRLYPAPLRGAVTPPPSKTLLHRQLICLAWHTQESHLYLPYDSDF